MSDAISKVTFIMSYVPVSMSFQPHQFRHVCGQYLFRHHCLVHGRYVVGTLLLCRFGVRPSGSGSAACHKNPYGILRPRSYAVSKPFLGLRLQHSTEPHSCDCDSKNLFSHAQQFMQVQDCTMHARGISNKKQTNGIHTHQHSGTPVGIADMYL
eukprot:scaffold757_cov76-Skeletonema_dohrnii-CCMP3373.AAC.3